MVTNKEYLNELINSCLLPELKQDFELNHIQNESFIEYHKALEVKLPILYDLVAHSEQWIFGNKENINVKLCADLTILLCELTASGAVFTLPGNENLLQNANRILQKHPHFQLEKETEDIIFKYYQGKLNKECWKRQLGSVNGFLRFLQYRHDSNNSSLKMCNNWITFCLSVGLIVRDTYDLTYKQLGIRIFQLMLVHSNATDIINLNVHSVVYDNVFKDIYTMDTVAGTADIWSCLFKCLDYFTDITSMDWSQVDDMMETLIRNISLVSDSLISICLLKFITKLGAYFSINRSEIEDKCNADLNVEMNLAECRLVCHKSNSNTPLRWAKRILDMFIIESHKLLQSPIICRQLLQEMHRCYMVCILPIGINVTQPHLCPFFEKFTAVLMEIIVTHKKDTNIIKMVESIIQTFYQQLSALTFNSNKFNNLEKYRVAFKNLLQHEIFLQNMNV